MAEVDHKGEFMPGLAQAAPACDTSVHGISTFVRHSHDVSWTSKMRHENVSVSVAGGLRVLGMAQMQHFPLSGQVTTWPAWQKYSPDVVGS